MEWLAALSPPEDVLYSLLLLFQNLTGIEKIVLKTKRNLGGTGKEVKLWELLHPWEEETGDLWQMGQVMMRAYDNEDFKLSLTVYKANSSEGYVAIDDVSILMKEVCDPLPAYAEPIPASSEDDSEFRRWFRINVISLIPGFACTFQENLCSWELLETDEKLRFKRIAGMNLTDMDPPSKLPEKDHLGVSTPDAFLFR